MYVRNNFASTMIVPCHHQAIILLLHMCLHNLLKNNVMHVYLIYTAEDSMIIFLKKVPRKIMAPNKIFHGIKLNCWAKNSQENDMQTQKQGCFQSRKPIWGNDLREHSKEVYECLWEAVLSMKVSKKLAMEFRSGRGKQSMQLGDGLGQNRALAGCRRLKGQKCMQMPMSQVYMKQGDNKKGHK